MQVNLGLSTTAGRSMQEQEVPAQITGLPKCSWLQPKSMALSHGERRSAASELHKGFVCSSLKQKLAGLMSPAVRQRQGV